MAKTMLRPSAHRETVIPGMILNRVNSYIFPLRMAGAMERTAKKVRLLQTKEAASRRFLSRPMMRIIKGAANATATGMRGRALVIMSGFSAICSAF